MRYRVCITKPNGEVEEHPLSENEVIIGSGLASTICLTEVPGLAIGHILLVADDERCWVGTIPGEPLVDEQGGNVIGEYVPWGSILSLGNCLFELKSSRMKRSGTRRSPTSDSEQRKISPVIVVCAFVAAVLIGMQWLTEPSESLAFESSNQPQLFDPPVSCKGDNAIHRAELSEEAAFAKSQRHVFDLQDGVEAVMLFDEAESCYRLGNMILQAEVAGAQGDALRRTLEEEYRFSRLRLQRSLQDGNVDVAKKQVLRLSSLLRHRPDHPYVLALRRLHLRLSITKKS